ncbi:MAG: tRNA (N(6)-L-threonylcarbamoyladenosine(37)-C(2))-methylthiotransferase MtaB [Candidatus Omnitrophica bacterium]|nr:tRNA (N(6)-L-threonylcarbamoyladenosine(37)-C(2))-methylthiotransferase MtaB [Candidatus Omnitrophota bacterium]
MEKRTFYIVTLGCKVNQYESQVIRERFLEQGYTEVECIDKADVCVVNTCTVTSTSDSKSFRLINNVKKRKKCVIATGCMVEDKDLDLSMFRGVDFIIKNKDKYKIPYIIDEIQDSGSKKEDTIITGLKGHTRVFVKVQDGCDNACSYCKVRVVRGHSRSRPLNKILDECRILIRNGTREIVLTGICLGAYGRDLARDLDICKLIKKISEIEGDWRFRLSSIEPNNINEDLIAELKTQKRLCKHLHLPFQSGDNDILDRMNRPYTREAYLDIVRKLRDAIPDIAISTDIMVGFPGETEKRFQNTLNFIKLVRPMRMHIFPYSKRKGTKAYGFGDNISNAVKRERENRLRDLAARFSKEFIDKFINREVEMLVEDKESKEGHLQGYTDRYIKVYTCGQDSLKGRLIKGQITLFKDNGSAIYRPYLVK